MPPDRSEQSGRSATPMSSGHPRNVSIDVVRGLAIVSVLLVHVLSRHHLQTSWSVFHIWQAVPIFMVLMGLNASPSVGRRLARMLPAWAVVYAFALGAAVLLHTPPIPVWTALIGIPLTGGPGSYFVAFAFQSVVLLPALLWVRNRTPERWFLAAAALLNFCFELCGPLLSANLYSYCILRYAFAIALGMTQQWMLLVPLSMAYLVAHQFGLRIPWFRPEWQPQNLFAFGYAAGLVRLGATYAPKFRPLAALGRASWSIFLVQMVYHGITHGRFGMTAGVVIPLAVGLALDFTMAPVVNALLRRVPHRHSLS